MSPVERGERHEPRLIMDRLAAAALVETITTDGDGFAYRDRLKEAFNILYDLWSMVAFSRSKWRDDRSLEPAEAERRRQSAELVLWRRRDPRRGYVEGFESDYQTDFSKDLFEDTAARYLARPWMRNAHLDWVLVDASITRELSVFGEEVKMWHMPSRLDDRGRLDRYLKVKGNLAELSKPDWVGRFQAAFAFLGFTFVVPFGIIWAVYAAQWTTTALWMLGIYALILLIDFGFVVFNLVRRAIRAVPKPGTKQEQLWVSMYQVWWLLKGPVINPTLVRAAMMKAAEAGAGWDMAAYSIIDSVIAKDPAVWVVSLDRPDR